ncbi:VOC family protein [Leptolyngbya sp. FACHB-261]|uniref:VOC family protein n=1 Tax=Leptolyngbya sp. FACHB-261 TaxID=2692806 RepID=UPI001689D38E|nr:VOC family protein [Leptolyngbya sp. FACHB-261]MBD2100543.1 VOC family protein [Leptolyngbya sp. FACHB-261]
MPLNPPRFHLAFPVSDLAKTRAFYSGLLGCPEGRSTDTWIDFDLFGHQLSAHLKPQACSDVAANAVDGDQVPVRHFGLILDWEAWHQLAARLKTEAVDFIIEPRIRFQGEVGEQATLFIQDPSGNALEFKSFKSQDQIFAH